MRRSSTRGQEPTPATRLENAGQNENRTLNQNRVPNTGRGGEADRAQRRLLQMVVEKAALAGQNPALNGAQKGETQQQFVLI